MHLSVVDCFVITMRACSKENERQGGRSKQKSTLATLHTRDSKSNLTSPSKEKRRDRCEIKTKEHPRKNFTQGAPNQTSPPLQKKKKGQA